MNRIAPGELIAHTFRPTDLERALGVSRTSVWRWSQPAPKGTGGLVPSRYHARLLALAQQTGVRLTPEDLVLGREQAAAA